MKTMRIIFALICCCYARIAATQSIPRQQVLSWLSDNNDTIRTQFESAEHKSIGDQVVLPYSTGDVSGADFGYTIGSFSLSYGYVVALAGDFYANWNTLSTGCVEQISDNWDTNPERSIQLALNLANSLSTNAGNYLGCIISTMQAQEADVRTGLSKGRDPAQVYESVASTYDTKYATCTDLGYAWIALCNWDHFGVDAVRAYSAVHTAALRQAQKAYQSHLQADLKQAYFLEAFAQHYLTDLFSTGHMRAPRRILHWTYLGLPQYPDTPEIGVYPADSCAQKMHDEDCSNGLWVTNEVGESWAAYGDKQLWNGKSARNFFQAVSAAQVGVTEVWTTSQNGHIPSVSDYAALKKIPVLQDLYGSTNFVPLFQWNQSSPDTLFYRRNIDVRNSTVAVAAMSAQPGYTAWQTLLGQISGSGENTNMYPFTQSFASLTDVWHVRAADGGLMIFNNYGNVDSGTYGTYWSMKSQSVIPIPEVVGTLQWISSTSLGNGVYSLVGRFTPPNSAQVIARHVGVSVSASTTGPPSLDVLWAASASDGNAFWTEGDTLYGIFSNDTDDVGMIKYWTNGPRGASKLELWTIPGGLNSAPSIGKLPATTSALNYLLAYQMQADDRYCTLIGYGFSATSSSTNWYFSSWMHGYGTQILSTITEQISFPAQALLSGKLGTDDDGSRLIRLFYGPTYSTQGFFRVDILNPLRNPSTGKIVLANPPITQVFPNTWAAYFESDYLTWFLTDVNIDGLVDLVALISPTSSHNTDIRVLVFPGLENFTFGTPIVSSITLDPSEGSLLTAAFMTPIKVSQAQYTYPTESLADDDDSVRFSSTSQPSTDAAIIMFFDNYGVLGTRLLAPITVAGTYSYELKGQTPAIAGQVSEGLGWTNPSAMGSQGRQQGIGFFFD